MQKGFLTQACRSLFAAPGDAEFLEEMGERFPEMAENFARFAAIEPEKRLEAAWQALKKTPRRGILEMGVPPEHGESVYDHLNHCMKLASLIDDTGDVGHLVRMMRVHDMAEAITGDFTPRDKIAKPDKNRLERMAFDLILEGNPEKDEIIALWQEYENNQTAASHLAHDIDKIDLALTAQAYIRRFPQLAVALYKEFVVLADKTIRTETGRKFFADLRDPPPPGLDNPAPRP